MTNYQSRTLPRSLLAAVALSLLLGAASAAVARDGQRQRGANPPRTAQPHTRTTERQRTENGHTRRDTWTSPSGTATRDAVVTRDQDAGTRTRTVEYTSPEGNQATVDTVRTRTDDGFTRSTTVTNAQGQTATRDASVTRDREAGTVTREANYSTFDGRTGSKTDVIQRTEDGYSRDTSRTTPDGSTHTRAVDVSCDKDAGKCVKQVETSKEP